LAIWKNQFNAAFQTASCHRLKRRCASTSAMNRRAEATVARWRARLQKVRYPTMASRYACRAKSLSLTLAKTGAQLGNQTPSEDKWGFIKQISPDTRSRPPCLSESDIATQKTPD
jgi:hypothetical protein